jgi:hypothetical protein
MQWPETRNERHLQFCAGYRHTEPCSGWGTPPEGRRRRTECERRRKTAEAVRGHASAVVVTPSGLFAGAPPGCRQRNTSGTIECQAHGLGPLQQSDRLTFVPAPTECQVHRRGGATGCQVHPLRHSDPTFTPPARATTCHSAQAGYGEINRVTGSSAQTSRHGDRLIVANLPIG